jgi:hypothetical protein
MTAEVGVRGQLPARWRNDVRIRPIMALRTPTAAGSSDAGEEQGSSSSSSPTLGPLSPQHGAHALALPDGQPTPACSPAHFPLGWEAVVGAEGNKRRRLILRRGRWEAAEL